MLTSLRGKGVLEECLPGHLLGHRLRHQMADNVANDDHPHSSIRFVQCCQSPQLDSLNHILRNIATVWLALQNWQQMVCCTATWCPQTQQKLFCIQLGQFPRFAGVFVLGSSILANVPGATSATRPCGPTAKLGRTASVVWCVFCALATLSATTPSTCPREKTGTAPQNFFFDTFPPRKGRCNNRRGHNINNFHRLGGPCNGRRLMSLQHRFQSDSHCPSECTFEKMRNRVRHGSSTRENLSQIHRIR